MTFFFHPLCVKMKDNHKVELGLCSLLSQAHLDLTPCQVSRHPFCLFCISLQPINTSKNIVMDFCRTAPIGVSPVARASLPKLFCVSQVLFVALTDLFASYFNATICCAARVICTFQLEENCLKMTINNHFSCLD